MNRTFKTLINAVVGVTLAACSSQPVVADSLDGATLADASFADATSPDATTVTDATPADVSALDSSTYNLYPAAVGPIIYWGGPIVTGAVHFYVIWYGTWNAGNSTQSIIEDMLSNVGGTPYSQIVAGYYQDAIVDGGDAEPSSRTFATGQATLVKSVNAGYTRGSALGAGDVGRIVADQFALGSLPIDTNGLYFVLTSQDVTETMDGYSTFCGSYCGYHDTVSYNGSTVVYSFVGDPGQCLTGCTILGGLNTPADGGDFPSPNNDWSADGMASVMCHELAESVTDPLVGADDAWVDSDQVQEMADMCAWRFEPTYLTDAGAVANVRFGARDYLVQQLWVNNTGCGLRP